MAPKLENLGDSVELLRETVGVLSAAVGPLGELAGRLPGRWLRGGRGTGTALDDRAIPSTETGSPSRPVDSAGPQRDQTYRPDVPGYDAH